LLILLLNKIVDANLNRLSTESKMRNEVEMQELIINTAKSDDRIRAVLLNGSRANKKVSVDKYQDFDIVYFVYDIESFTSNHNWTNVFGDKIIMQLPDEMVFGKKNDDEKIAFHYLMLFKDGNRIDLTLFPINKPGLKFPADSLTIVWLDKDNLFSNISEANDFDYLIKKPTEKEFLDACNEFWWVCTNVSKGLLRNEITYSKEMLESFARPMFMKIIEWYIGTETDFSVSFGKAGRFMKQCLTSFQYDNILATYSDYQIENNWKSLFVMTKLFGQFAIAVADKLNFKYNLKEEQNVTMFLNDAESSDEK
jgi:aminoglycoside 6-adenylyltransferase